MENTVSFKCEGENLEQVPDSIIQKTGISFPKAHTDRDMMALLAKEIRLYKNDTLCRIPFCVTTEAEAFGAVINLGDANSGPRVQSYAYGSLEEMAGIAPMSLEKGRIKEVLDCVEMLSQAGETVALTVEGPLTIMASLLDPLQFYKGIRKNREIADAVLTVIEDSIVNYALEGIRRGARIISYGDPVGGMEIVGPKVYADISGKSSYRILKRLEQELDSGLVHICGKTTTAFTKLGLAEAVAVPAPGDQTYGQALDTFMAAAAGSRMVGHQCIKKTPFALKGGTVWEIRLT